MRIYRTLFVVLTLGAMPVAAAAQAQPSSALNQAVERIVTQENAEVKMLRQYSPLVETYIQQMRPDGAGNVSPAGDQYFLGRAVLSKGVDLEPLTADDNGATGIRKKLGSLGGLFSFSMEFLPRGFLQMI